jgi:tRNA pseudouridine13 synthase
VRIAATPEDFVVEELPLFEPEGAGDHLYVRVEKRLCNTEQVARALAREAGVSPREVGYAGRKDRVAVARQWLSVPGLAEQKARGLRGDTWRVLDAVPHRHKLRTGQLAGNRFTLRVREVTPEEALRAREGLPELAAKGFPNRFGPQRFGREGDNAARGRAILAGAALGRDRRAARFLVSAFQAEIFNAFLERRGPPFDRLERGEVAWKHDSGASFVVEDAERESLRAASFELSPSGPILGTKMPRAEGEPGERERAWLREWGAPEPLVPPRGLRLRGGRRPLRARPDALDWAWESEEVLRLEFSLASGCYATVLIESLLG